MRKDERQKGGADYVKANACENVIVYQEPGRFGGWPANHGIWSWGDEILVGFERAWYQHNEKGHSIVPGKTHEPALARSMDGGATWRLEQPDTVFGPVPDPLPCPGGISFDHPDFAMKCAGNSFYISMDRGRAWQGPYRLPDFGRRLTSRTDYLVTGPHSCLFFLSAHAPEVKAGLQDRAFCVRTVDGGVSFEFLGWMTGNAPPDDSPAVRSVMPATVRGGQGQLVSALRRRQDVRHGEQVDAHCWIDVYQSLNGGCSWIFLSKVADTGGWNGNPPGLLRLRDGRLCAVYGCRAAPFGMRARLSADDGRSWGAEIILRDDGLSWDLGYPRIVQRSDGCVAIAYYYATTENPEQHIAATIWDVESIE